MMRNVRTVLAATLIATALAACGQRADLEPRANGSLPIAPHGAETPLDAEELLHPDALAAPERSVELRRRSEEREDDPFDLPPE